MSPEVARLLLRLLDVLFAAVELAPALKARKDEYVAALDAMVTEGRSPTEAELSALLRESADLTAELRAAAAQKAAAAR